MVDDEEMGGMEEVVVEEEEEEVVVVLVDEGCDELAGLRRGKRFLALIPLCWADLLSFLWLGI